MVQSLGFAAKDAEVGSRRELASRALNSTLRIFFISPLSKVGAVFDKSLLFEGVKRTGLSGARLVFPDESQIKEIPVTRTGISTW
jgi:hypothetical protein